MLQDPNLRRDIVELLGRLLADALERRAVERAELVGRIEIVRYFDPGQVGSELLAAAPGAVVGRDRDRLGRVRLCLGDRLDLVEQLDLNRGAVLRGALLGGAAIQLGL